MQTRRESHFRTLLSLSSRLSTLEINEFLPNFESNSSQGHLPPIDTNLLYITLVRRKWCPTFIIRDASSDNDGDKQTIKILGFERNHISSYKI